MLTDVLDGWLASGVLRLAFGHSADLEGLQKPAWWKRSFTRPFADEDAGYCVPVERQRPSCDSGGIQFLGGR